MKKLSRKANKLKKSILHEYEIVDEAQAQIDEDGLTVEGDRGQMKAHPLLSVVRFSRTQFLAALKSLNLDLEPLHPGPGRPGGR